MKNNQIESSVAHFLKNHYQSKRPLLLGFSGGPDSLALFLVLKKLKVPLLLAHVDHGWRAESKSEAAFLQQMADKFHIPFYLKVLSPNGAHNLEAICRKERLDFFKKIYEEQNCEGIVLGHHGDDQAETVLKRIFEGANLIHLEGISEVTSYEGMRILRPFLAINKSLILKYLKENDATPFEDSTNLDPKFLRGRLRTKILPELSQAFGKEISSNLQKLGSEVKELKKYFYEKAEPYFKHVCYTPNGIYADFSTSCPSSTLEVKFIVQKLLEKDKIVLSYSVIEELSQLLLKGEANRYFQVKNGVVYVDRKRLFIFQKSLPVLTTQIELKEGGIQWEGWSASIEKSTSIIPSITGWKELLSGSCSVFLPFDQNYRLGLGVPTASYQGKCSLGKWWSDRKVPTFLRNKVPVIWQDEQVVHEFLTGASPISRISPQGSLLLKLSFFA